MYEKLLTKIKEYKNISIFRHVRPDGDAMFSSFALKEFIETNFKNKHVEVIGKDEYDLLPYSNVSNEKFISSSLSIILDTATLSRCDTDLYKLSKYIIKIDHHPNKDKYGDINIVDDLSSSTCELLSTIFFSNSFRKYKLSKECTEYLYAGILTDSIGFKTSNTSYNTLHYASLLAKLGQFDISALNNYVFSKSIKEFNSSSKLRTFFKIEDNVGYIIADKKLLKELGMSKDEAKNAIDEFNHINGLKIWAIFAEGAKKGLFDGSIRSKSNYTINTICSNYNGGGHKNACGVKSLSNNDINRLIKDLKKSIK